MLNLELDETTLEIALRMHAKDASAELSDCGHGRFQIHGLMNVNYWPFSRNQTAFIAATSPGGRFIRKYGVSPDKAVKMAYPKGYSKEKVEKIKMLRGEELTRTFYSEYAAIPDDAFKTCKCVSPKMCTRCFK